MLDHDTHKTISELIEKIGSQEECLRLGFLDKDDNETLFLTPIGLGYLLDVVATELNTLEDAYAAGFKQGQAVSGGEV